MDQTQNGLKKQHLTSATDRIFRIYRSKKRFRRELILV